MCEKLICLIFLVSTLAISTAVQADVFSDDFETPRDYLTAGVTRSGWDGLIGLEENETVDALNASMDRTGQLYIESSNSYWEGAFSPRGPLLYKIVQGDFIATVQVTDFAGEEGAEVFHNDSFIMARVPDLRDAGPGEDFECVHYFPTWVGNIGRSYNDNSESEWGFTGDGFDCATYIQLERVNNNFHFRISFDGQTWTELVGSPVTRNDLDGLALQVGLGHSIYSTDTGYVAFDNFHLEGPDVVSADKASLDYPANGAIDMPRDIRLSWKPGVYAETHDVYFGIDFNDVNQASRDNSLDVLVSQDQEDTTYDPAGLLEFNQTYYWRVDEVNEAEPNSPWKGPVWNFTTANFIVVDDFEDYNDFSPNEIWNTWIDGYGDPTNGATAGYPEPVFFAGEHYMETTIVHGGDQSMPVFYDNSEAGLSEVTRTLNADWTQDDVLTLTLWYYGEIANAIEPMFVALNGDAVVTNDDPKAALDSEWNQWDILLQDFADMGVDLANINTLSIGLGNKANPQPGGTGHVFIDDIRLYRSLPKEAEPEVEPVDPGTDNLVAYYAFENNTQDGSGNGYHGTVSGNPQYVPGLTGYGMAIDFDGTGDYVTLPIGSAIAEMNDITVATWANFPNLGGPWQRLWDFGSDEDNYMFVSPRIGTNGPLRFAINTDTVPEMNISGLATLPSGWHHVTVTIDSASMTVKLYQDGKLVAEGSTPVLPSDLGQTTQNYLGRSQFVADAYYQGSIDEFRIYDRTLSLPEVLYLVGI